MTIIKHPINNLKHDWYDQIDTHPPDNTFLCLRTWYWQCADIHMSHYFTQNSPKHGHFYVTVRAINIWQALQEVLWYVCRHSQSSDFSRKEKGIASYLSCDSSHILHLNVFVCLKIVHLYWSTLEQILITQKPSSCNIWW